jgi:hypothetical protein
MSTKKKIELIPDEHSEQVAVIQWAEMMSTRHPELKLLFAIPNGGNRNIVTAKKLKAEGVKPGTPDLFLPVTIFDPLLQGALLCPGLFIEMKRRKGGSVSTQQRFMIEALKAQGYRVEVCKGAQAAIDVLCDYLGIEKGK